MALEQCRDCNHAISTKAFACPQCGRMLRARSWWAATIFWAVIAVAVLSLLMAALATLLQSRMLIP